MLEFLSRTKTTPAKARVTCDQCSNEHTFTCDYGNEGQANRRLTAAGWKLVKKKTICSACAVPEEKEKTLAEPVIPTTAAPTEPTRQQKRQIMDALEDAYDLNKGRYIGGETDDTLAKTLGVLPGWVAKLREEFFGPDGGNEDIDVLLAECAQSVTKLQALLKDAEALDGQVRVAIREVQATHTKLDAIKKAVGPRVLKLANL